MNCLGRPIRLPAPPARTSAIADLPALYLGPSSGAPTPLRNLTRGLQAALAFEAALDGAGAGLADPLYFVELFLGRLEQAFQGAELPDKALGHPARQARHPLELAVPPWLDKEVLQGLRRAVAEGPRDLNLLRELLGGEGR